MYLLRFLEDQCAKLKVQLKWPENLMEFQASMKNLREESQKSEQNLFEEICKDVQTNANFARQQISVLRGFEDDLNKLTEQKAVLEACGSILADQNIMPKQ